MDNKANNSIIYLNKEDKDELLSEVKETIAAVTEIPETDEPGFGSADLWNIQKRKKNTTSRRSTFWN